MDSIAMKEVISITQPLFPMLILNAALEVTLGALSRGISGSSLKLSNVILATY
jgi:hypothetical protein